MKRRLAPVLVIPPGMVMEHSSTSCQASRVVSPTRMAPTHINTTRAASRGLAASSMAAICSGVSTAARLTAVERAGRSRRRARSAERRGAGAMGLATCVPPFCVFYAKGATSLRRLVTARPGKGLAHRKGLLRIKTEATQPPPATAHLGSAPPAPVAAQAEWKAPGAWLAVHPWAASSSGAQEVFPRADNSAAWMRPSIT